MDKCYDTSRQKEAAKTCFGGEETPDLSNLRNNGRPILRPNKSPLNTPLIRLIAKKYG